MGLDRFATFISKSINGDGIDELNIKNNMRKIISNHIIFDLNFLIYQEIIEIENEINDIIKILLCLPFSLENTNKLEELLQQILSQKHWKHYFNIDDFDNLFDGFNEDEIVQKFINFISSNMKTPNYNNNTLTLIELVIYEKIINTLIEYIENLHITSFIQSISIFFDGIPSMSKIIEQRRRRIKNFIESMEKKELFKKYFNKLSNNNKNLFENMSKKYINDTNNCVILFDYFKWVNYRFSIDKSIGPASNFIKNLELFINIKLEHHFSNIKIYISNSKENGEADLKIFKYICDNDITGECSIHTTDSDLIHQILIQHTYNKIINKDINYTVIKYIKNSFNTVNTYVQIIESNLIIKNILDLYNSMNNIKTNNYKIIWDLCLIFYLFGNDHLPSSIEIGPELGLEFFIKNHYSSLNKNNIVNLKKSHITIDLNNLKLYLEKINEFKYNNITKILLQRFFKINPQLITLFVDKLELNHNTVFKFLELFITNIGKNMNTEELSKLDNFDMRKKFVVENKSNNWNDINFSQNKINIVNENEKLIYDNLDFYEYEFNGLILYSKPHNLTNDSYQDLYDFISDTAFQNLTKKYSNYYEHYDIYHHLKLINNIANNDHFANDYLKKIYHLTITQFGNMSDFHTDNLTWFKGLETPSLFSLINYINNIPDNINQTKNWLNEIKNENVSTDNYLNSVNHHLIITPFIASYNLPPDIQEIIKKLPNQDNLWLDLTNIESFNYREFNIQQFIKLWNDTIIQINLNTKTKIHDEIINLNTNFI